MPFPHCMYVGTFGANAILLVKFSATFGCHHLGRRVVDLTSNSMTTFIICSDCLGAAVGAYVLNLKSSHVYVLPRWCTDDDIQKCPAVHTGREGVVDPIWPSSKPEK